MTIARIEAGARMSQAVVAGGFVPVAGQVAGDRKAGIEGQSRDVLAKINACWRRRAPAGRSSWLPTCSCPTSPTSTR